MNLGVGKWLAPGSGTQVTELPSGVGGFSSTFSITAGEDRGESFYMGS